VQAVILFFIFSSDLSKQRRGEENHILSRKCVQKTNQIHLSKIMVPIILHSHVPDVGYSNFTKAIIVIASLTSTLMPHSPSETALLQVASLRHSTVAANQ